MDHLTSNRHSVGIIDSQESKFFWVRIIIIIIIIINLFIQCRNITQNNLDVESWGGCANSTEKKINFEKLKRKQSKGKHGKIIKVKSY